MNKNSIITIPTMFPNTDALAKTYDALESCMAEAAVVEAILKEANGNLCEAADFIPDAPTREKHGFSGEFYRIERTIKERTLQREQRRIIYYAARLRLENMIKKLSNARLALVEHSLMYREQFDARVGYEDEDPRYHEIARINVFFCDQLALEAYVRLKELNLAISHGVSISEHWAHGKKIDLSASLKAEYVRSERIWVVQYSGWGSKFRHSGENPESPPPDPYLTLDEARIDAGGWECTADTIGGQAQLFNVKTGETTRDF
ncbi:MAG: hypothetical protein IPG59_11580 [Candidatus Melainabacteria bacterium]|nr:MAG: hypothetical protein IPG59_11580 [Candidatus Melainabacteria bacterium]